MRPEVFIVESLGANDEREGKIIRSILRMGGKSPVYRYVKTKEGLEDAIAEFHASDYRYLHISSHGNSKEFCFQFGALKFKDFADLLRDKLRHRRLFVSACKCVNSAFRRAADTEFQMLFHYRPLRSHRLRCRCDCVGSLLLFCIPQ